MALRRVNIKEVMEDVERGLAIAGLKKKYNISDKGIVHLFNKLREAGFLKGDRDHRTVIARELLDDIRSGVGKTSLMLKHGLSQSALQGLVTLLLDAGEIKRQELYGDLAGLAGDTVHPEAFRARARHYLDFETLIYDAARPEIHGKVLDLSEDGLGVQGLEVSVEDVKKFVVLGDPFGEAAPFEIQVNCRWTRRDQDTGVLTAGFRIMDMSDHDREELQKLIKLVTFGD
jgi:predicted transcriptional regulator